jgi:hypothetical protein
VNLGNGITLRSQCSDTCDLLCARSHPCFFCAASRDIQAAAVLDTETKPGDTAKLFSKQDLRVSIDNRERHGYSSRQRECCGIPRTACLRIYKVVKSFGTYEESTTRYFAWGKSQSRRWNPANSFWPATLGLRLVTPKRATKSPTHKPRTRRGWRPPTRSGVFVGGNRLEYNTCV